MCTKECPTFQVLLLLVVAGLQTTMKVTSYTEQGFETIESRNAAVQCAKPRRYQSVSSTPPFTDRMVGFSRATSMTRTLSVDTLYGNQAHRPHHDTNLLFEGTPSTCIGQSAGRESKDALLFTTCHESIRRRLSNLSASFIIDDVSLATMIRTPISARNLSRTFHRSIS